MVFFEQALHLEVRVDDYFFIGRANPRAVVVEFETLEDKRSVMKAKTQLKNLNTGGGKQVYINEYLPLAIQEKRKRERKIIADIEKELDPNDEEADSGVAYTSSGLTIHGVPYRKKINPPTPRELLDLEPEELKEVLKTPTKRAEAVVKEGSRFIAYTAPVRNLQNIRQIYMKLKLVQPNARHIVCSYILKEGGPVHATHDFHDDGEPGSGRILLELMERNGFENCALFIVRKYGGFKLGAERYNCYLQAARRVLDIEQDFQQTARKYTDTGIDSANTQQIQNQQLGPIRNRKRKRWKRI